jgi:glycosyltransferase involved in cell wall biosynthesis
VVVPAYNCAAYLGATLDSVSAQTLTEWECVVVDDGSPDGSAAIAQGYAERDPRFRVVRQANAGVAAARNAGYAAGHPGAAYVVFQDSDDVWAPDALASLAAAADAHPEAAGAHGLADRIGSAGEPLPADRHVEFMRERNGHDGRRLVAVPPGAPTTLDCLVTKFRMFPPGAVLVRRPLVARAGLWTEARSLAVSADWDFFARVGRFGAFVFVDRVVVHYRKHDANMTARDDRWPHYMRRQAVLRHLVAGPDTAPEVARLVRRTAAAWGWGICAANWAEVWASLRRGQRRSACGYLCTWAYFVCATAVSDLDLRLHGGRRRLRPSP